jgi:DNA-binding response OmpR family regulator
VLIADDDPGIQDALRIIFEQAGYEADIHPDGQNLISNNFTLPDIFILDKQLSGIDGLDICRFLKSQSRSSQIPIIILSASTQLEKMVKEAGADDWLEKPFFMNDLLSTVHRHIIK